MLAAGLFVLLELAMRLAWRPDVIPPDLYSRFDGSYNYGYARDALRLFRRGNVDAYYPTEYINIRRFSLRHPKAVNEIRIFTFGGSVSRGSGLTEGADYSAILERSLNGSDPEFEWRVINLSADGIGSTRMYRLLRRMVAYEPDVLILHLHGSNEYEDERDAWERERLHRGVNALILQSHFLVLFKKLQSNLPFQPRVRWDPSEEERASADPANLQRWIATLDANTRRMDCIATNLRIPAIYIGRAERDGDGYRNERVERMNGPIRSRPLFVDTAAELAAADGRSGGDLFMDNTHLTRAGHEIVARRLHSMLRPGGSVVTRRLLHRTRLASVASGCDAGSPDAVRRQTDRLEP